MRIYVFVSDKVPGILGFTLDPTGGNLPDELGPGVRRRYRGRW